MKVKFWIGANELSLEMNVEDIPVVGDAVLFSDERISGIVNSRSVLISDKKLREVVIHLEKIS